MPELPEVETICRSLSELIRGQRVARVEILERRLRVPIPTDFPRGLQHRALMGVSRRGKFIVVELNEGWCWVIHLGMSGKLVFHLKPEPRVKHDHVVVTFESGAELTLHDPRRFGLSLVMTRSELQQWPPIAALGLDPWAGCVDGKELYRLIHRSRRRIYHLLLDQRMICGLGNIYVNEILFRTGVRPSRRGLRMSRDLADRLAQTIPLVLDEAIAGRGTSFSDYRDGMDQEGDFQNHLSIYDREGQNCVACSSTVKRTRLGGRSAFYCPTCQT